MTSPLAMTLRGYAGCGPSLWRPHLAAAADAVEECARLRHDIERHVAIAADLATEAERLRAERDAARDCISFNAYRALEAERDAARADALALAAERNNWQSMYQDAMAERDAARALLREANNWIGRDCTNVREQIAELTPLCNRIDAALKGDVK